MTALLIALSAATAAPPPLAADAPTPSASCLDDALCNRVFTWTGSSWFADSSYMIIVKPLRIVLILVVALVARRLVHKTINRLVRTTSNAQMPAVLRPLRERLPSAPSAPAVFPERRRQRAEAIGSVLRNFVSVGIFSIAALLVLGELNFDLAPLLASAGIVGLALGFGAQSLVKDLIAGLFMLLEDQYGVGDTVDLGEATGIVEAVGLRITTVRDARGVLWYIRNGEIIRVGNRSQGWAMVVVDIPIGFTGLEEATAVLGAAAGTLSSDPQFADSLLEPPNVLGVEQITVDGAVVRTTVKTSTEAQFTVARELRRRLTEALEGAGITARLEAARTFTQQPGAEPGRSAGGGRGRPGPV